MIKKIYHISGFDCPNCANKVEAHLNANDAISKCHIDFSTNKMFIEFKKEILDEQALLKIISQVESDPLLLKEANNKQDFTEAKLFSKDMYFLLGRILISIIVALANFLFVPRFDATGWIRIVLYMSVNVLLIYDVFWRVLIHLKNRKNIIDHNLLITIAVFGATTLCFLYINENNIDKSVDFIFEAMMVICLFQIGQIIEKVASNRSKLAIMNAIQLRVEYANLLENEQITKVKPEQLQVNDVVYVGVGEMIPIDGEVVEGSAYINKSSLTGEFVPELANSENKQVYAGCLVESGYIKVKVLKIYEDSAVSKIIQLISNSGEKKSKADRFIARFARFYTPVIVALSVVVFIVGGLFTHQWRNYFVSSLEILVTGCPCAIVISVPLAFFSAIGLASKRGIVIKGTNYLDEINEIGKVISDKTGTLTEGIFSIRKVVPSIGVNEQQLMDSLYAGECLSSHPIAKAICHGQDLKAIAAQQKDYQEIAGKGVKTIYQNHHIYVGSFAFLKNNGYQLEEAQEDGVVVYCQKDDRYLGYIVLNDKIKPEAKTMVDLLHRRNMEIILLTGDKKENAIALQKQLGIDRLHYELSPEDKIKILENEMSDYYQKVAFVGDGINDAPSIRRSDIGFAMGAIGSDIAVENADVIIMNDNPLKIYDALKIASMARNTAIFNIVFALLIKLIVAILVVIPTINIPMAIPVIADTGLTVVLVINSLLVLYRSIKYKK